MDRRLKTMQDFLRNGRRYIITIGRNFSLSLPHLVSHTAFIYCEDLQPYSLRIIFTDRSLETRSSARPLSRA